MKIKTNILFLMITFVFTLGVFIPATYAVADDDMTYEEKLEYIEEYKTKIAEKKQQLLDKAEQKTAEIKEKSEERAREAKEKADQKKLEVRQQLCEKKSDKLEGLINNRAQTARGFYERFTSFNDKVERFIETKSLDVDNYVELYRSVADAESVANVAITELERLKFEVNCSEVDLTTENAQAYRDAVVEAREALKQYKVTLVNLLRSVVTSYNASESVNGEADSSEEDIVGPEDSDTSGYETGRNDEPEQSEQVETVTEEETDV